MNTLIDYAAPMMQVEKLLKDMHNDLLEKNLSLAFEKSVLLIAEARILSNVIVIMKEKEQQNALRKQAPTLQERVSTADQPGGNPRQAGAPTRTTRFGQKRH